MDGPLAAPFAFPFVVPLAVPSAGQRLLGAVGTFGRFGPGHPLYMEWMKRAECVHEDPELFFPVGSSGPALRDQERAKEVCRRCPVSAQCLDWAVNVGRPIGVWGGTTEQERERLRRRAKAAH